ncbi:type IV pilus twitching motility protein PilT [Sporomusa sp.]|uniref:type IV pilus twitching motility protein PilT n=1 Tax=Sporomusa sp. TaxID=2078658 RepID=UPI002CE814E3|nr:type IV pilus twitching motility protein PilT [Sporomusa sp.]HWR43654.1 type IV pilus twitching motility protein PilT [Sporomusa sp.]
MLNIDSLLKEAVLAQASDIHLTVGVSPIFRLQGSLTTTQYPRLEYKDTEAILTAIINPEQREKFELLGEIDFSYAITGLSRFRVNAFRQRGSIAIAIRVVTEQVPTLEQLGHPEVLKTLARKPRGLVLVTGPTGSGKSTTLAAMLDLINTERACHIITLEDPIEYLHKHKTSIVNQREINADTKSFGNALRAALREDPDVILVGEMRDVETISIAITAAETGHLVFATLHTGDAAQTIDRIIDVFPPYQQQQIRIQLSLTLQGIVAQQLLPRRDDAGRVAAVEVLMATPAVRNLIREGKTHQLVSVIQTGAKTGMQAMDMSLRDLYRRGIVTYDEALARAMDQETFVRLANG